MITWDKPVCGPVESLDREALAWAAGFYDGEGNFWTRAESGHIRLTIHQCDFRPLQRFHRAVMGVGKLRGPYQRPHRVHRENDSPMYTWSAQNHADVRLIIGWLWEFLSEPKREQIDKYAAIWESRPKRRKNLRVRN